MKTIPSSPKDDFLQASTWLSQLTSLQELHGVDDGVVSVYAERHKHVGRSVEQHDLKTQTRGGVGVHRSEGMHITEE